MPKVDFLVPKGLLLFLWDRLGCGLGWSFGGLGWVEQIGPTDNSGIMHLLWGRMPC